MPKNQLRKAASKRQLATNTNVDPQRFTPAEAAAMAEPHSPQCFLVCCIDSRFQPDKALDYGPGVALEYRQIAAAVPPEESASPDFLGRMAFRRLNKINHIVLITHSDCGGAQAALKVPHPDPASGDDLHAVAAIAHRSGLDIPALAEKFMATEGGSLRRTGDHLAREIGIRARENLLGYKGRDGHATVGDEVKAGALKILLLYYDLEQRSFELFDPKKGVWKQNVSTCNIISRAAPALHNCAAHHHRHKEMGAKK